jgi:hypothetical protein
MGVTMIRVSQQTRDTINEIARNDYGGVSADEALRRMASEHKRARWVEQARRLREEQPERWETAVSELVELADGTVGDGLTDDPWHEQS